MQDPQDNTSKPFETSPLPPADAVPAPALAAQDNWARETLEKLAFANLKEQRSDRRWKLGLRLAWMAIVVFALCTVLGKTTITVQARRVTLSTKSIDCIFIETRGTIIVTVTIAYPFKLSRITFDADINPA